MNSRGVDTIKTNRLRQKRVLTNTDNRFDFGPARTAWEQVFDDETICNLNKWLNRFPKSVRQQKRRKVFEHVVPELRAVPLKPFEELFIDLKDRRTRLEWAMADLADQAASLQNGRENKIKEIKP